MGQDTVFRTTESGKEWPVYMMDFVDKVNWSWFRPCTT